MDLKMKMFKITFKYICEGCGKYFRIKREHCMNCGAKALRKAKKNDYRKVAELMMIEQKEYMQIRAKARGKLDKTGKILRALVKNDAEFKELLKRKKAGESVEDLITKNRDYYEKLKIEDKEHCEISKKWWSSEEGRYMLENMAMQAAMNPIWARNIQIKHEIELRKVKLNDEIQKNEEEYENLLERKNEGEYVDDLIKQNRYTAEKLKKSFDPSKDKFETRPSLSTIREKKIFHYLKKNSGKAFTAQSLYNRIDDIGLEEEAKASLDMDALEEILINLYVSGKITRQDKEGKSFYFF